MALDYLSNTFNSSYEDDDDALNERTEVWYANFIKNIHNITNVNLRKWIAIVSKMGLHDDKLEDLGKSIYKEFQCFLDDLVKEAANNQNILINNITNLLQKSEILCKQLAFKMPDYGKKNMGLYDEEVALKLTVDRLENEVHNRLNKINNLNKDYRYICNKLNITEFDELPIDPLPSLKEMHEHLNKLQSLKAVLYERERKYEKLKLNITNIIEELKIKTSLGQNEDSLLNQSDFIYSEENMANLYNLYEDINKKKHNIQYEIDELKENICKLWNMLGETYKDNKIDLNNYTEKNYDVVEALQTEVSKCIKIKRENLKIFIYKLRKDIVDLWDKCKFSENDRSQFEYFEHTTFTEELLELHEIEIRKLEIYYRDNSNIFELLDTWENLWTKMVALEKKAKAPNRFRNRGGQLLREERERNSLSKKIPKIEDSLLSLVEKYKIINKKEFLCMGKSIEHTITIFKEKYENEKKQELHVKKQLRDLPLTPNKSVTHIDVGKLTPIKMSNLTVLKQHQGTASPAKRRIQSPLTTLKKNRINDIS